jgi:hypothetical protein
LGEHAVHGKIVRPVHETVEVMAELGRYDPARAVAPREVIADQTLGEVVAITLGGVNEVDATVRRSVEDGVGLGLREIAAPLAAELPRAQSDDGHAKAGLAESSITHGRC